MAKDRLVTIEQDLKELIAKDKNDPKVYEKLFELIYKFFLRNKIVWSYDVAKEISHTMAEDLYLRILNPEKPPITSWIGYIYHSWLTYVVQYQKSTNQIIDALNNIDLEESILRMISASSMDNDDINMIYTKDYLKSIPKIIDDVLDKSHFYKYTKPYIDAKASLLLSIAQGTYVPYNLNEIDSRYVRVLYRALCERIVSEIRPDSTNDLGSVQFYLLDSNNDIDYEGSFDKWTY